MTARRRRCRGGAALAGVGLLLLLAGRPATGQETVVAEPTPIPPTTLAPTTTSAPTSTTAPVTTTTAATTTTTVATPTTTAESATTTTGVEPTTTTAAEGTVTTRVSSTSVPVTTTAVPGTTKRDAELARGRAVALQRNARARQVGGVVEPTDDAPDLASLFDRVPAPRGKSTQERSGSGLFVAGLTGAVVAGLALGLRDRSVTLRADPS